MNYWQGKKIRLRAIEPSDAEYFYKWDQDSERARNLDFVWPPTSRAHAEAWVNEDSKRKFENDTFRWMIENESGEPVGSIDTHHCMPRDGTFSLALDIAKQHRRKGYAREAVLMILKYYFEELRYQKATVPVHSDNEASIGLHESLGFQKEGTLRRMFYSQGKYFDVLYFGMTVEEFRQRYT